MQLLSHTKIDFIGKRKAALISSAALILIGLGSLLLHKGPNYGIDFLGGTSIELHFDHELSIADVRAAVSNAGYNDAEIKNFGAPNEILIRVEEQEVSANLNDASVTDTSNAQTGSLATTVNDTNTVIDKIKSALTDAFPDNPYVVQLVEKVGPKIGSELRTKTVWAILIALFFILLYISWRFEFVFSIGAIVALFHDVLITLGVFSVLQLELTLPIIAAFLTIVGYSLNDTIVVFDRIRENLKVLRREAYETIVNTSINQSLSRTIVTSLTTMIVILVLYIFGGEVIHNFAFALIIGVIVGTYSSIFIASPILVEWEKRREFKKGRPLTKKG